MSVGTISPPTFQWTIPNFGELLACDGSNWIESPDFYLPDSIWYLALYFETNEWLVIKLIRKDSGAPKTITYTIQTFDRTDVMLFTKTSHFALKYASSEAGRMKRTEKKVESNSNFTCYITFDTYHVVAGREFVTCSVQTEVANSVVGKENPKDEDWSPLDIKGVALLSESMKDLLNKSNDTDVTFCVQGKEYRAHRNILRTRSAVFTKMLAHDTTENNIGTINIEDCDPESFDEFLLYVYSGRTENLTPSNALKLYYTADKYDFPVLKERCVSLLKTSLSVESICDVVLLAAKHQEKDLLQVATEFFARNMKKILVTVGWQMFMSQNPVEANELYIKTMEILLPEN